MLVRTFPEHIDKRTNGLEFKSCLALVVVYIHVKFEVAWSNAFRKSTPGQTELDTSILDGLVTHNTQQDRVRS